MKGYLRDIGINCVEDLVGRTADELYAYHNAARGFVDCRCVLYVYRCAVYYANEKEHDPEKLDWSNWKD